MVSEPLSAVHCHSACDIAMTFDTVWAGMTTAAVLNNTSPRFRSRFWTELQIGDKRVPVIGHLRYTHGSILKWISANS